MLYPLLCVFTNDRKKTNEQPNMFCRAAATNESVRVSSPHQESEIIFHFIQSIIHHFKENISSIRW